MIYSSVQLDTDYDWMRVDRNGYTSIQPSFGADTVGQNLAISVNINKGQVWFNETFGIDKSIFNLSENIDNIKARVSYEYTQLINSFDSVERIDGDFNLYRLDNVVYVTIPCVILNCENTSAILEIGEIRGGI